MVCIYCGSPTQVTNSRRQRRSNNIWRRRTCTKCGAVFTTNEAADLTATFMVQDSQGGHKSQQLMRDKLFLSIYRSCEHRPTALADAASLTSTVISTVIQGQFGALIPKQRLTTVTYDTLKRFDPTAAVFYRAYFVSNNRA